MTDHAFDGHGCLDMESKGKPLAASACSRNPEHPASPTLTMLGDGLGGGRALGSRETGAEGHLIGAKSDTLIRMMALTDVDFGVEPGQKPVWAF